MHYKVTRSDRVGLMHPAIDAHTLGISSAAKLFIDCEIPTCIASMRLAEALVQAEKPEQFRLIADWIKKEKLTVVGFSYRLDPADGLRFFQTLMRQLTEHHLFSKSGGSIRAIYFAGLPETCRLVAAHFPEICATFIGDETPFETLERLGIDARLYPAQTSSGILYDEDRLQFGKELIKQGIWHDVKPVDRIGSPGFGTRHDRVIDRLAHGQQHKLPPLMRAHVGPYLPDRRDAVGQFIDWAKQLATSGLLDILSIGTSQLSQADFFGDWTGKVDGGGVPIHSAEEFEAVWQAARPMLVRTYAGTRDIPRLAQLYESTINMAWHTLSFWWFCQIDGRGPYPVLENLRQHFQTLEFIAKTGKPFEPNVPHHFAFRGADDVSYIVSGYLAARAAKSKGIKHLILQIMLNTPKYTFGIQDLAKARTMLQLVRSLEDDHFQVFTQPRGGLDYFSPDLDKAKAQLAAVTALMADIEPLRPNGPDIIHVVGYSEAAYLADPRVVNESIQITVMPFQEYQRLRAKGEIGRADTEDLIALRQAELLSEAWTVIKAIDELVPIPIGREGMYAILANGFLPLPYLWNCQEEINQATLWHTRLIDGAIKVVAPQGSPLPAEARMAAIRAMLNRSS